MESTIAVGAVPRAHLKDIRPASLASSMLSAVVVGLVLAPSIHSDSGNSGDFMEEQRKHAILLPPKLLSMRKPVQTIESDQPNVYRISF